MDSMKKTQHCKIRQWERGISDYLLEKVKESNMREAV